jgi:hypothetical protein
MTAAPPTTALATRQEPSLTSFEVIEKVITAGDLSKMSPQERIAFYWRTCESLQLNPLTRPFEFINLNGKLTMYARKDATDQLRRLHGVTVTELRREKDDELGLITVYARGKAGDGREDEATGVVAIKGLSGEALANGLMKAESKAKRRLTLSLVGLGFLDESEVEGADRVDVDPTTGEITERSKPKSLLESVKAQQEAMAAPATAAAAPEPAQAADDDTVEGSFTEAPVTEPEASTEPTLADTLRAAAIADGRTERAAQGDVVGILTSTFRDWDRALVLDGLRAVWGKEGVDKPTAAQVAALKAVGESMPAAQLVAAWREMVGGAA